MNNAWNWDYLFGVRLSLVTYILVTRDGAKQSDHRRLMVY